MTDKTHFEFNVSFYADADHFEEDPARLVMIAQEIFDKFCYIYAPDKL